MTTRRGPLAGPLIAATLLLAACSGTQAPDADPPGFDPPVGDVAVLRVGAGGSAGGPGISVSEALTAGAGEELLVNGALFVAADGSVQLCEAIAESFPPQCGGARIAVEGLDLDAVPDLEEEGAVRWAEAVQLFGSLERP